MITTLAFPAAPENATLASECEPETPFGFAVGQFLTRTYIAAALRKIKIPGSEGARVLLEPLLRWQVDASGAYVMQRDLIVLDADELDANEIQLGAARDETMTKKKKRNSSYEPPLLVVACWIKIDNEAARAYREQHTDAPLAATTIGSGALWLATKHAIDGLPAVVLAAPTLSTAQRVTNMIIAGPPTQAPWTQLARVQPFAYADLRVPHAPAVPAPTGVGGGGAPEHEALLAARRETRWYVRCIREGKYGVRFAVRGYVHRNDLIRATCAVHNPNGQQRRPRRFLLLAPGFLSNEAPLESIAAVAVAAAVSNVEAEATALETTSESIPMANDDDDNVSASASRAAAVAQQPQRTPEPQVQQPSVNIDDARRHALDRLVPAQLAQLSLYVVDRATRNRLCALLVVYDYYYRARKQLPPSQTLTSDIYYLRQYPNGEGAPVRSVLLGPVASAGMCATVGLALACLVVAPDARQREWLQQAEVQLMKFRNIACDIEGHLLRLREQFQRSREPPPESELGRLVAAMRRDIGGQLVQYNDIQVYDE